MHGTEEGVWTGRAVGTTIVDKEDRCEIERSITQASTKWEAGRMKVVGALRKGGRIFVIEATNLLTMVRYLK